MKRYHWFYLIGLIILFYSWPGSGLGWLLTLILFGQAIRDVKDKSRKETHHSWKYTWWGKILTDFFHVIGIMICFVLIQSIIINTIYYINQDLDHILILQVIINPLLILLCYSIFNHYAENVLQSLK